MPTVQDVLKRKGADVFSITQEATVLDAARLMNEKHVGALVITRGDTVIGIFTERDVLNRVVAPRRDPAETNVKDVMTAPVAVCRPETTRAECRSVMRNLRIRHLPVVKDERLMGIVSIGDILQDEGDEQQRTIHYLYEYMYGEAAWAVPIA